MGMVNKRLQTALTAEAPTQYWLWLGLSLLAAALYASLELQQAFRAEFVVQDDARQHVFWMQRFLDPGAFPNDLIADYFQSVAPAGYATLYRAMASLGLHPMLFNKLLPMGLGLITTGFAFNLTLQFLPIPAAGFVASVLLNQNLWLQDDLASGTARAFLYPIFLAFLYYLLRRSLIPMVLAIVLQGLFYPQFLLIMLGVLAVRLLDWTNGLRPVRDRQLWRLSLIGIGVAIALLLPYALESSVYGPTVTAAQARMMPEFGEDGRTVFFINDSWKFWLSSRRSGAFVWVMPLALAGVFLVPLMKRFPQWFPLIQRVKNLELVLQVATVSLGTFAAAHLLLFTLYLPSRYSQNSWQILTALLGGIATLVLVDALLRSLGQQRWRNLGTTVVVGALALVLLGSPYLYRFPKPSYEAGTVPSIYNFFAQQPQDILIASIAAEADNLPSFAQRSVLASKEYMIPYQTGYYAQVQQRARDTVNAHYTPRLPKLQAFIRDYGIDFWLVDRDFLTKTQVEEAPAQRRISRWLQQFEPDINQINRRLQQNKKPALARFINDCSVARAKRLVVLDAQCILNGKTP